VTVDVATPEGRDIVRALASCADILLENYKAGTLSRYGLAYDDLKAANPRLIYCSITGFGQDGPRAKQAAYDFMIQAMGGLMSVTGAPDDAPGGGPQKVGVPIVDLMTGMYAATAVLAALHRRSMTGEGDFIDLAMLDVQTAFLANQAMNHLVTGDAPKRTGNKHPNIQPQNVYRCRDGFMALAVGNDGQFRKLCEAIDRPELGDDPRFATNVQRVRNLPALDEILAAEFAGRDVRPLSDRLDADGVPCSPINTIPDVLADPQVVHRRMVREIAHPTGGVVPQVVSPMRFRNAELAFDRAPPLLGQDTDVVLGELGFGADDIDRLRQQGVV
jgi:crotonobetainyl-CoA:carnitine CoA-transferase CaiB-like acyl-CoA transferase